MPKTSTMVGEEISFTFRECIPSLNQLIESFPSYHKNRSTSQLINETSTSQVLLIYQ